MDKIVKFPKLYEFCINHNINWKINKIEYVCENIIVTFSFVKDGHELVIRRYIVSDQNPFQTAELLIDELRKKGFAKQFSTPAFDPISSPFINEIFRLNANSMKIKNVIFQDPATIVFWEDGTKTVVRAEGEDYDPEKGLAMAISRKALGNNRDYYNTFIHWLKKYKKDAVICGDEYKEVLKKVAEVCKK